MSCCACPSTIPRSRKDSAPPCAPSLANCRLESSPILPAAVRLGSRRWSRKGHCRASAGVAAGRAARPPVSPSPGSQSGQNAGDRGQPQVATLRAFALSRQVIAGSRDLQRWLVVGKLCQFILAQGGKIVVAFLVLEDELFERNGHLSFPEAEKAARGSENRHHLDRKSTRLNS